MEKALIEKMNKDMTEIKNLWEKVSEGNDREKEKIGSEKSLFAEKLKIMHKCTRILGHFFQNITWELLLMKIFPK